MTEAKKRLKYFGRTSSFFCSAFIYMLRLMIFCTWVVSYVTLLYNYYFVCKLYLPVYCKRFVCLWVQLNLYNKFWSRCRGVVCFCENWFYFSTSFVRFLVFAILFLFIFIYFYVDLKKKEFGGCFSFFCNSEKPVPASTLDCTSTTLERTRAYRSKDPAHLCSILRHDIRMLECISPMLERTHVAGSIIIASNAPALDQL